MQNMEKRGLVAPLKDWLLADRPFFGICIGYQLLFESSEESPDTPGLGILEGKVGKFAPELGLKVPHMGWNTILPTQPQNPIWKELSEEAYFYFVHSYFPQPVDKTIIASTTDYGSPFASSVQKGNLFATQFHPEKSQHTGLQLLKNFIEREAWAQAPVITSPSLSQGQLQKSLCVFLGILCSPLSADNSANLSLFAKGVFSEIGGEQQQARQFYQKALEADPHAYPLTTKTSRLQLATQDLPAATQTLRTFAKNHRKHLDSQLHYASFLKHQASSDKIAQQAAIETLELANTNFPHHPAVYDSLILHKGLHNPHFTRTISEYHRSEGRIEEAINILQKHLTLTPSSHSLRTRLGLLQLHNQDESAGEATLLQVLAIHPEQTLAHNSLAKLYRKKNHTEKALHHRAEGLRISGGHPQEAIELANEYLALEQAHQARLLLEKFRFDYPENPAIHARLAIATLRDGLPEQAARLFRQAEALAKDSKDSASAQYLDADFQIEFANSLLSAGAFVAAETRLRQAAQGLDLDDEPKKYARAVTALAQLWIDQGKNEAPAKALLQRAISIDPENATAKKLLEAQ